MIRLNVFIQVSESNRAAVLEAAKELVASSLKDKGCISYDEAYACDSSHPDSTRYLE